MKERNGAESEDGTKGGSLSRKVSMSFKENEVTGFLENDTSATTLCLSENHPERQAEAVAALESEAIQMFIVVARFLGYPRSVGEIFGVLFAAEKPLTFQGISRKGGISAGSLSVGLCHLRNLGVVITAPVAGDRRDHHMVDNDFVRVNTSIIRRHVEPRVFAAQQKIDRIRYMADKLTRDGTHGDLVTRLQQFADSQTQLLKLIAPLLNTSK